MNLGEGQVELAARGFDYLTPTRTALMLNDAKDKLEDAWEFPWLQTTTAGPAPLEIVDLKYVVTVKTDTNAELVPIDLRVLAQGDTDLQQIGAPEYWYLTDDDGDQVVLRTWPLSEQTITVVYIRVSPELVDPGDTPLIPSRYHSLWLDLAVIEAYHDTDNFAGANALQADVNARMQALIERYETRNRQMAALTGQRYVSEDD